MTIEICRFDRKNALTIAMYEGINEALAKAESDPGVRVVVFRGNEECFSAGNDLMDFMQNPPAGLDSPVFQFIQKLPVFEKPMIAAVAGPAVGVGVTMLLHCDLVIAATNARLKMPFVSLGLVPEAGSTQLLPQMMGYARAAELLLLGETITADKAYELGLANRVVDPADLFATADQLAGQLAEQPPAAVRLTKSMLRRHHGNSVLETIAYEGGEFAKRLASPEAQEAMAAFMQKRKPDFSKFE